MKTTPLRLMLCLGLACSAGATSALQYDWSLNKTQTSSLGGAITFTSTSGGKTLSVTAYETTNGTTGKLLDAKVVADGSWGLGVLASDETSYPDTYTIDNHQKDNVLVFDAGTNDFDWSSLALGFIYTDTGIDSTPDVKFWSGNGTTGFDFNNFCLQGTCTGGAIIGATGTGFNGPGTVTFNSTGTAASLGTAANSIGRYLVVSGDLSTTDGAEKFKISSIGGKTPEPQSIALLGVGLLAMLGMRRRSSLRDGRLLTPA